MNRGGGGAVPSRRPWRAAPALAAALLCWSCRSSAPARPPGAGADHAAAPAGSLPCGGLSCDTRSSYCEVIKTDAPALPSDYACRPLPEACRPRPGQPQPGCGCFPRGTRCDYCVRLDGAEGHGFRRMCVGGY